MSDILHLAAAVVVLRDGNDAHPRDVIRNAVKDLVAVDAWRIERALVKVSLRRWEEQAVLVEGPGAVPGLLAPVHARLLKVPTVPTARGDGPRVRNLRMTGSLFGGAGTRTVGALVAGLEQAGYVCVDARGGLGRLRAPRYTRTPAGDRALADPAVAVRPDRPAGSRWWPNSEQQTFDALFDRWFDSAYDDVG